MQTRRDKGLIVALCSQAAISAAASSAALTEIATPAGVAVVGLLNAMLSSATAAYVGATRERDVSPDPGTVRESVDA